MPGVAVIHADWECRFSWKVRFAGSVLRCTRLCKSSSRLSKSVSYTCHVNPSTHGAASRTRRGSLFPRSATDTWCRSAVNRNRFCLFAPLRTQAQPPFCAFPQLWIWEKSHAVSRVLLGGSSSLCTLRRRLSVLVRVLRRYYTTVRLPTNVHVGLMVHRLLQPARSLLRVGCW